MIVKNYKYINLAYKARYLIFLICISKPIFFEEGTLKIAVYSIISFFLIFVGNSCENIVQQELNRRMSKLPVPKNQIFKWARGRNIGYAFIDLSKGTIWFCGTQTKFELHVYMLSEFERSDSNGKIHFQKNSDAIRENELKEFTVYTI